MTRHRARERWTARSVRHRASLLVAAALAALSLGDASSSRADDTRERLEATRQLASEREAEAAAFNREASQYLAELEAIDLEVIRSRRSQRELKKRQKQAERQLDEARAALEDIETSLAGVRQSLEARLVALYKARGTRGVPALYAAGDLQAGLRMYANMERILEEDVELFGRFSALRERAEQKETEARSLLVDIEGTEAEYLKRKQREKQKLVERRNLVDLLRTRADRALRVASELRDVAKQLEEELRKGEARPQVQSSGLRRRQVPKPVSGKVRLGFGRQVDATYQTTIDRTGIEIDAPIGQAVRAVGTGQVMFAGYLRGYGRVVIVDHGGGTATVSGYLDEMAVEPGDPVLAGQVIGTVGETGSLSGPGLYFELRKDGGPVDPEAWFAK